MEARARGMAGPGFEPGMAEPVRLQRIPFDRSGIPPGALSLTSARRLRSLRQGLGSRRRTRLKWLPRFDFVLRVLRTSQHDCGSAAERSCRYVPAPAITNVHEQRVAPCRVETLDNAVRALIAAARAERHHKAALRPAR